MTGTHKPHLRSRLFRSKARWLLSSWIGLGAASGCKRATAPAPEAAPARAARESDAEQLPTFMDAEDERDGKVERFRLELGDAPTRGPESAPITIVMFSDFECPYCQRGHDTLLELERRYAGDVRIAYKAFPLDIHSNALMAAMAARTAQAQGKFWEYHDLLFSQRGLDVPALLRYAEEVGVQTQTLQRDLESLEYGPEVRRDLRQGRKLGVSSTPTFFINGRPIAGAQPLEAFEEIIAEELELAEQWKAQGVPPDQLYEHAIEDGYEGVVYTRRGRGLDPYQVFPVPIGESPTSGPADAPVTVVVFGDFECPFCARGHETLEQLRSRYADELRVVYKHQPLSFHSHAFVAARASLAAHQQGKFWEFHDGLYAMGAQFDEDDLVELAKKIGLDMKKFHAAMNSTALDEKIEADMSLAMALGVSGTPAYFVNGRPIEGALPELQFRLVIEEELDRAKAAREAGVPPGQLYEHLTHTQLE